MAKRIVILGAGESGTGAAVLAKVKGFDTFVSDAGTILPKFKQVLEAEGIAYEENTHTEALILNADEVIKSPGIPDKAPMVKAIREKGIAVMDELAFAARYSKAKLIGITGSNGKTTTTLLTYHILKNAGYNVGLGGNVGQSMAMQVARGKDRDWFVLEISSFQLDGMQESRLDVAVLTNITPDHLDRYDYDYNKYIASKMGIFRNQTPADAFITFTDNEPIKSQIAIRPIASRLYRMSLQEAQTHGAYASDDCLHFYTSSGEYTIPERQWVLQGKHNKLNTMAAVLASYEAGLSIDKAADAMQNFVNAEHRLQPSGEINGVMFINDSKATNVDSVYYALDAIRRPIVLIAGGVDKGNDYAQLDALVKAKVKGLVCLGTDNTKLMEHFKNIVPKIEEATDMPTAVRMAFMMAQRDEVVLLSPACASFDLFKNYEDRGQQFMEQVTELSKKF